MNAVLHTSAGDITLELFETDAPKTVANFVKLAKSGFYDGTKFHRVIKDFMIQGGDPLTKDEAQMARWGTGGPGYTFPDEINAPGLSKSEAISDKPQSFRANNRNDVGTISMANAGPNTNGSQFFINVKNNDFLDRKHTVFGRVSAGMDVVHEIEATEVDGRDKPVVPMVIKGISIA